MEKIRYIIICYPLENVDADKFYLFRYIHFLSLIKCFIWLNLLFLNAQNFLFSPVEGKQQLNEEKVRHIIQLKDGRLAVFTEGMLNLYNGEDFTTIHINDGSTLPITNYTGYHISYIENNHLWFKTRGKLAVINISEETCEDSPLKILNSLGFIEPPKDLFLDGEQNIWMLSQSGKLLFYNQQTKKVNTFLENITVQNKEDLLFDLTVYNQCVYLFYKSGLLRCFDFSSGKELYHKKLVNDSDTCNEWSHVYIANKYLYIVRTGWLNGKLLRFDPGTKQIVPLIEADSYWLNTFASNKNGDCIMSCRDGLWYFPANSTKGTFYNEVNITDGRKMKTEVSTVLYDRQGGLWIGTLNKGLYYYHPNRFRFQKYEKQLFSFFNANELSFNCFEETNDNKLLIGTNYGLIATKLPLNDSVKFSPIIKNVYCNALYKEKNGTIWISTFQGLFTIDTMGKPQRILPYATNYVKRTNKNELYAFTTDGVFLWNSNKGSFQLIKPGDLLPGTRQIAEWENQLVGICDRGPFVMDLNNHNVSFPLNREAKKSPMFQSKNYKYTCLLTDIDGDIWFGTYDGLNIWSSKENKLYELYTDDGLINNSIKGIVEDNDHSVWITTSRGVSHIYKKKHNPHYSFRIVNYNEYDGIIEHPCIERSIFISSDGTFFAGGIDGINIFQKKNQEEHTAILTPILISLKLFGKTVPENTDPRKNPVLQKSMAATDTLILSYKQNFFSIEFSGLNYINPGQTYYRYKLEGVDENWRTEHALSGIGDANYTNLTPGEYSFKVQASSDGIHWESKPRNLIITITPPFWMTIYAQLVYLVIILLLIWLVAKGITYHQHQKRQKEQEETLEKAKSEFMTNISHELRTPLTLIITPLKSLLSIVTDTRLKTELLRINANADLMLDTVNQLLEFKKTDTGNETLHLQFYGNLAFIEELCNAYAQLAHEKGIYFITNICKEDVHIYIDRQKITRIIINLLSNAIKFTEPSGTIHFFVNVNQSENTLTIGVQDTGTGIAPDEMDKIFNRFYQAKNQQGNTIGSGIGLYMVKQYALLHGGDVQVKSTPGKGTDFTVNISVKEKELDSDALPKQKNGKKNILIIEDHLALRKYLTSELQSVYTIDTAANGKEGLKKVLGTSPPDLVITDMMMPEMTGPDFCKAIRNNPEVCHIPVIMLTGKTSDASRIEGYEAGADSYLVKPFDMKVLQLRISKLFELGAMRYEAFAKAKEIKAESLTSNSVDRELMERALLLVEKNLSNPDYSVEKFSTEMGMDRTGLYRKLTALTNHSPTNFIRTIRLKRAAELLSDTGTPVADIAYKVGFNSVSYFSKCFHDTYGITPSQYREKKVPE